MTSPYWLGMALAVLPTSLAWTFSVVGEPTVCQPITLNFTGGSPPWAFEFIQFPPNNSAAANNFSDWNVAYPWIQIYDFDTASGVSNGAAEILTKTLDWPFGSAAGGSRMVIVGSDADGFATGGTSEVLTIANSTNATANCSLPTQLMNETDALSAFRDLPTDANECVESNFTYRGDLIGPISIDTIVPGGRSYRLSFNTSHENDPSYANQYLPSINWSISADEIGDLVALVLNVVGSTPVRVSQLMPAYLDCPPYEDTMSWTPVIVGITLGCVFGVGLFVAGVLYLVRRHNIKKRRKSQQAIGLVVWKHNQPDRLNPQSWGKGYRDEPEEAT